MIQVTVADLIYLPIVELQNSVLKFMSYRQQKQQEFKKKRQEEEQSQQQNKEENFETLKNLAIKFLFTRD